MAVISSLYKFFSQLHMGAWYQTWEVDSDKKGKVIQP